MAICRQRRGGHALRPRVAHSAPARPVRVSTFPRPGDYSPRLHGEIARARCPVRRRVVRSAGCTFRGVCGCAACMGVHNFPCTGPLPAMYRAYMCVGVRVRIRVRGCCASASAFRRRCLFSSASFEVVLRPGRRAFLPAYISEDWRRTVLPSPPQLYITYYRTYPHYIHTHN